MNNIINNRKQVYSNLPSTKLNSSLANIVLEYDINSDLYQKLTQAVQQFICKSMALAYDQEFSWTPDFLEKNNKLLAELPNKTPNGIINPKKETSQEFTLIQNILNQILDDLELYPHIDQLLPFNIRYKSPIETDETKSRPYYTGKYHSDAWVGHVGDSQFLIGVLGDINNNTVEFTEPTNVLDTYLDKASTFEEGQTRYSGFNHLGFLTKQKLAIMDHACLHRTYMKEGAGPRISIDIAVMIDSKNSLSNTKEFKEVPYTYRKASSIYSVGKDKIYSVKESIFDDVKQTTLEII